MEKSEIFNHWSSLYETIAEASGYFIDKSIGTTVVSGLPSLAFNFVKLKTLDSSAFIELKNKINLPFLCTPDASITEEAFAAFMDQHELRKGGPVTATIYKNLNQFEYKNPHQHIRVRLVENTNDFTKFDELSSASFNHQRGDLAKFFKIYSQANYKTDWIYCFLAEINGVPVGQSMLVILNNIPCLYWGSVHPDYRNLGIANCAVQTRMEFARRLGFDKIICQNLDTSLGLFKKIGFNPVGQTSLYVCQPA